MPGQKCLPYRSLEGPKIKSFKINNLRQEGVSPAMIPPSIIAGDTPLQILKASVHFFIVNNFKILYSAFKIFTRLTLGSIMKRLPKKTSRGTWLQTERSAHEAWGELIDKSPKAAKLMHFLTARIGEHNAVVVSIPNLTRLMNCSRPTVLRALKVLRDDQWIEVRQIGGSGTTNAYIINNRVAWHGTREGIRYGLFSANVIVSDDEQPDRDELGKQETLRDIPALRQGEQQLPSGDGLPPISSPSLPGMEPVLPAKAHEEIDIEDYALDTGEIKET